MRCLCRSKKATPSLAPLQGSDLQTVGSETCSVDGLQYANTDFLGSDFQFLTTDTAALCNAECKKTAGCKSWTWVGPGYTGGAPQKKCHLKNAFPTPSTVTGLVSGIPGPSTAVSIYVHACDTADVYLNGLPLRTFNPSYVTRGDEAPKDAWVAYAYIKPGDVFTVGSRRGGGYGFLLAAVDVNGKVLFKSDTLNWKTYTTADTTNWYRPEVAKAANATNVIVGDANFGGGIALAANTGAVKIWNDPAKNTGTFIGIVP